MDTLISLNIKTSYKNFLLPKIKEVKFTLNDFYKLFNNQSIFEFKEYDNVEIYFFTNNKDITIKVESYYQQNFYKRNNRYDIEKNMIIIQSGESITLSPGGDSQDILVPGQYSIQICKKNEYFNGFFTIIPSTVDWETIVNIKYYLEKTVKGLSYNIYLEKKVSRENSSNIYSNIELYRYLYGIQDKLLNALRCIINNPILDIKKEYIYRKYSKNPNSKSQRWLVKKGVKYSQNILMPDLFNEKYSYLTHENLENIILKKIIGYIQNILAEAEYEYVKRINSIDKQINELEFKKNNNENIYNSASNMHNTHEIKIIKESRIKGLEKEIIEFNDNKDFIRDNLNKLHKLKANVDYYMNETWLREIDLKYNTLDVTSKILKNHNYNDLYLIYNKLRNSNTNGGVDIVFPNKKTSKLFEIYSFLITKSLFEDIGFKWISGWLKSRDMDEILTGDLVSGDFIIMQKNQYKVIIEYDKYIGIPDELKDANISQPATKADNKHRRPDILISLYEKDKLLGCEVIEVKYRRKFNIYNTKGIETDVCKQLSSYTGFDYYDAKMKRVRREKPVYKVLTLYPKQDKLGQYKHDTYDIEFIPIMPDKDDSSKYYGYDNLKREINEFLCFFINS